MKTLPQKMSLVHILELHQAFLYNSYTEPFITVTWKIAWRWPRSKSSHSYKIIDVFLIPLVLFHQWVEANKS